MLVAAALLLVAAGGIGASWWSKWSEHGQLALVRESDQARLRQGQRLETERTEVLNLDDGLSEITIDPGSVVWVDRLRREVTQLRLERGRLHAFVSADAKERFFQVKTRAVNCVDLGCKYTLAVDAEQTAHVRVEMGRVAFEDRGREVIVPASATCTATRQDGAGTPRHQDTPASVVTLLDEFDASRGPAKATRRTELARRILSELAAIDRRKYSLIAWHFLQDPIAEIRAAALAWLLGRFQVPEGLESRKGEALTAHDLQVWRESLESDWGW